MSDIKKKLKLQFLEIEKTQEIEVPYETSLRDVRDMIVWDDDQFDITNGHMTEFDVYLIEDEGNEWQVILNL